MEKHVAAHMLDSSTAVQSGNGETQAPAIRLISLLLVVYIYDDLQDTFKQLPGMPAHIPLQIHNARKALQLVDEGMVCSACICWGTPCLSVCQDCLVTPQFSICICTHLY